MRNDQSALSEKRSDVIKQLRLICISLRENVFFCLSRSFFNFCDIFLVTKFEGFINVFKSLFTTLKLNPVQIQIYEYFSYVCIIYVYIW